MSKQAGKVARLALENENRKREREKDEAGSRCYTTWRQPASLFRSGLFSLHDAIRIFNLLRMHTNDRIAGPYLWGARHTMITMVALAKRFRMRFAMEGPDRLSNTRCSHARSTNISNDHCHTQCLQASSTTTSSVDVQKHKSHPKKFSLLHHLEHREASHSDFSHTLACFTSCPASTIAHLWTQSMPISHKQGLYARRSVDLCIGCTPLSSQSRVDSCGDRRTIRLRPIDLSLARSACLQKPH